VLQPLSNSPSSRLHVYTLLRRQTSKEDSNHVEQICTMIRQVKLFPISIKFDFRKLSNNSCELETYFDADLIQFVNNR
jgi:hypothetical protein